MSSLLFAEGPQHDEHDAEKQEEDDEHIAEDVGKEVQHGGHTTESVWRPRSNRLQRQHTGGAGKTGNEWGGAGLRQGRHARQHWSWHSKC